MVAVYPFNTNAEGSGIEDSADAFFETRKKAKAGHG